MTLTEAELSIMINDLASPSRVTAETFTEYVFRASKNQRILISEIRRLRTELKLDKCQGKYKLSNTFELSKGGEYRCDVCGHLKLFGHNADGELCEFEPMSEADELREKLKKLCP